MIQNKIGKGACVYPAVLYIKGGCFSRTLEPRRPGFKSQPYQYLLCDATKAPSSLWASPCEKANT